VNKDLLMGTAISGLDRQPDAAGESTGEVVALVPAIRHRQSTFDEQEPACILVIDDNASILEIFRKILCYEADPSSDALDKLEASLFETVLPQKIERARFAVDCMQDGEAACNKALQARNEGRPYAVAFVDMRMPGGWDGLQTIQTLWQVDPHIHVVICTAFSDYSWDDITAKLGSSDRLLVLRKPFEKIEVLQLASALSQKWALHREQQLALNVLEQRVTERTRDLVSALAEREVYASQLQHQATHDTLTGLANRDLLRDRLSQAMAYAARYDHPVWVVFIDLDRFKAINDTLGHKAGDALLNTMSLRLQSAMRETDTVARIGGDEFVLVLPGPVEGILSTHTLQRIMEVVGEPTIVEGRAFSFTCSIGVAIYPTDGTDPETLIEHADIAMYRAKETGRNNFQFFTMEMNLRLMERVHLEQSLRDAIGREEFELHYQPQVDLRSGRIIGAEALIRWNHPGMGMVPPLRFIGLAEECGLIGAIGAWVIRSACAQNKAWQRAGLPPIRIAVNLSARQLTDPNLVDSIADVLRETELDPAFLEIEITESSVMADVEHSISVLRKLKELGVQLSVDDFGTGYSSLSYLKRFPIDVLKIDQSFVRDVESDPDSAAIVLSIISLAHNLRLHVIAEGVEEGTQLAYLQGHACDFMQGYHFSRPLPAGQFEILLQEGACLAIESDEAAVHRPTLLIIDDDETMLTTLRLQLNQDGYRILTTSTAIHAFELLATNHVEVVICDQRMPTMNGIELLSKIKALYPNTVRIMLSAYSESQTIIEAINRGAIYSYFVKPCDSNVLREGVRNAIQHRADDMSRN
jgi:diguanylate cyclase (GGDEF)-like protein